MKTGINAVAPFLRTSHGYVVCVEDAEGEPIQTASGDALFLMAGMLHGDLDEMVAQADYAFARAGSRRVTAVIETQHPSFRFPDLLTRQLFKSMQRHDGNLGAVYIVNLSRVMRIGFRLATPFMSAETRSKVKLLTISELAAELGPSATLTRWGGAVEFDGDAYLSRRAALEGVRLDASVRPFHSSSVASSNRALKAHLRQLSSTVFDADAVIFGQWCEKRGGGGLFGSLRWKRKYLMVTQDHLAYAETDDLATASVTLVEREHVQAVHRVEDARVDVTTDARTFMFRFEKDVVAEVFASSVAPARTGGRPCVEKDRGDDHDAPESKVFRGHEAKERDRDDAGENDGERQREVLQVVVGEAHDHGGEQATEAKLGDETDGEGAHAVSPPRLANALKVVSPDGPELERDREDA